MVMHIVNYAIRGFIFLLGILMLFRVPPFDQSDKILMNGLGIIFILFGALRLITYYQATHRFQETDIYIHEDEETDDDTATKE